MKRVSLIPEQDILEPAAQLVDHRFESDEPAQGPTLESQGATITSPNADL